MGATQGRGAAAIALILVALGCGSDPLRPDGGSPGSGGQPGSGGSSAGGGASGADDAAPGRDGAGGRAGSGGAIGSGGATGLGGGGGAPGSGGASGSGGRAGTGGAGGSCGHCQGSLSCCGQDCLDLKHDQFNCGACGNRCPAASPFCDSGVCKPIPCGEHGFKPPVCGAGTTCCGQQCCGPNQLCCSTAAEIDTATCHTPTAAQPTCPIGCGSLGLCM